MYFRAISSSVPDGVAVGQMAPWQAKCKNRVPTSLIFWFYNWLLFFLRFSEYFPVIQGFYYSHPHTDSPSFLKFFSEC